MTRHSDIDHRHTDGGQLTDEHRPGQLPQRAQFSDQTPALGGVAKQGLKGTEQTE